MYFNVLAARIYKKYLRILDGRGVLVAVADDAKIQGPPEVIKEMAKLFPTLAWEEACLACQTAQKLIYMESSADASWSRFLDMTPRNNRTEHPVHDIPDVSELVDPFDPDSERIWREENGVNILGAPLGPNSLCSLLSLGKGAQASAPHPLHKGCSGRGISEGSGTDAEGSSTPRMAHILRSVQKNKLTVGWMT
jgi:hypothetical protein